MTGKQQDTASIDVLLSGIGDAYTYGLGMDRENYEEALRYYRKAASMGNSHASYMIGQCLFEGKGCHQSISEALDYYESAAEQGNSSAMIRLGDLYWNGVPSYVASDKQRAADFYIKAMDQCQKDCDLQNLPTAYCRVAECMEYGVGMEQNTRGAYYLYQASADGFHTLVPQSFRFDEKELEKAEEGLKRTADALHLPAERSENIRFS